MRHHWQNLSPDGLNCNVRQKRNKVPSTIKKEWADIDANQILSKLGGRCCRKLGGWHRFADRQQKRDKEQLVRRAAGPTAPAPGASQSSYVPNTPGQVPWQSAIRVCSSDAQDALHCLEGQSNFTLDTKHMPSPALTGIRGIFENFSRNKIRPG